MNTYSPPGRLRRYDLIFIDEAFQITDEIWEVLWVGIRELPQKPFVVVGADYKQVAPIGGGSFGQDLCEKIHTIELTVVHRTDDPTLLNFLDTARKKQPSRTILRKFFADRLLRVSLGEAVKFGMSIQGRSNKLFVWLCVTNKGVRDVNLAAISQLVPPITEEELASRGYPTDPNVGKEQKIIVRPGITIRCTRNIDKERGFVNGAIAVVHDVLADYDPSNGQHTCIFTAKLSTGSMILVHPVSAGRADAMHDFLPCTYGYATTIRRAQGAALDDVWLYFDAKFPPDRGYGYVGASRCRNAAGLYYFKRLRRTDWLPIGGGDSDEESERGSASDAESVDPYDGWCGDQSDCSSLRSESEGYVTSDGHESDIELDEFGEQVINIPTGDEIFDGCEELFEGHFKRRRVAE